MHPVYADQLLARPDLIRKQAEHARLASSAIEVPAAHGGFPSWEYTASSPSSKARRQAVEEDEADDLRVVGHVRAPTAEECPHVAVVEVAFRGSKNMENWMSNFTAELAPLALGGGPALVHRGFQESYLKLRGIMLAMVSDGLHQLGVGDMVPVLALVTGHSLGGAMATLAAYDFTVFLGYTARCVTFGCPRVGDADFVVAYGTAVPETARFVNKLDPICRLPMNTADENDDGTVIGNFLRTVLESVTKRPSKALGMAGYYHVCKGTMLDDVEHNNILSLGVASALQGKAMSTLNATHKMGSYSQNLERRLTYGCESDAGVLASGLMAESATDDAGVHLRGLDGDHPCATDGNGSRCSGAAKSSASSTVPRKVASGGIWLGPR